MHLTVLKTDPSDNPPPGRVTPVRYKLGMSQWQVKTTNLNELSVVAVAQGLPVAVEIDAFPGVTLNGEVRDIAATAAMLRGDVTYVTTIDLLDPGELALRWGMTAFVNVLTDENGNLPDKLTDVPPVRQIEAQGRLVPQWSVNLAFNTGGRVAAISASEASIPASETATSNILGPWNCISSSASINLGQSTVPRPGRRCWSSPSP